MRGDELSELHYITPIANVASICRRGILSHRRARTLGRESIAMEDIQMRRRNVVVPGGRPLHQYANLYICARNPMMYKRKDAHRTLTVLRISPAVLDLPGAVVTDGNASSGYTRFAPAPRGLDLVDRDRVFADDWRHPNTIEFWEHRRVKCAEVLVPDRIPPEYLLGAYVSCRESQGEIQQQLQAAGVTLQVSIDEHLFFL